MWGLANSDQVIDAQPAVYTDEGHANSSLDERPQHFRGHDRLVPLLAGEQLHCSVIFDCAAGKARPSDGVQHAVPAAAFASSMARRTPKPSSAMSIAAS